MKILKYGLFFLVTIWIVTLWNSSRKTAFSILEDANIIIDKSNTIKKFKDGSKETLNFHGDKDVLVWVMIDHESMSEVLQKIDLKKYKPLSAIKNDKKHIPFKVLKDFECRKGFYFLEREEGEGLNYSLVIIDITKQQILFIQQKI